MCACVCVCVCVCIYHFTISFVLYSLSCLSFLESHAVLLVVVASLVSVTLLCILLTAISLNKRRRPLNEDFALTPCNSHHQLDRSREINSHAEQIVLATPLATAVCFGPAAIYLKEEAVINECTVNHSDDVDTTHVQSVSNEESLAPVCG